MSAQPEQILSPRIEANRKPRILVVDDEVQMVRSLELLLRPLGEVVKTYSVPEATEELKKDPLIDCIITDVNMPEATGLSLLDEVRKKNPEIPVVIITAYSSVPQAVEAMQRGAFEYVVKPFENKNLYSLVRSAIEKRGLELGRTKEMPRGWIGNSEAMKEFLARAQKLLESLQPVLLVGETGVGKKRAARWLHEASALTSKKEFVSIDGRAHEEDSPLLKRSFGKEVGCLFVAEVFSLKPRLQDRLAEILSQGKVRILAASSSAPDFQNPGSFRQDLLEQLTTLSLRVPSLKERKEDFEALVREKLRDLSAKLKGSKLEIHPSALIRLKSREYAGNVRELERVLERASIEAKGGLISEDSLIFENGENLKTMLPFTIPVEGGWTRLEVLRESLERDLITSALEKYPQASNTQIAQIMGTTRRILELRMKDYAIRDES